jgi:hypothetical protein
MNFIYYKNYTHIVASEWNELTGKQLRKIMRVIWTGNDLQCRFKLFRILTGWSWKRLYLVSGMFHIKQISFIAQLPFINKYVEKYLNNCARLFDAVIDATHFLFVTNDLVKNLIPVYRGFYGPDEEIRNVKMAEFTFSEIAFLAWKKSKDPKYLDDLVAILYRPGRKKYDHRKNSDGDHREPFNPNLSPYNAKQIAKWPMDVKLSIATFYMGCREKKIIDNERVFSGSGEGDESLYGLWSVMRNVAKAGHFGDFDKVQDQYIDTILMELNEVIVEAEKREEEIENMKNKTA